MIGSLGSADEARATIANAINLLAAVSDPKSAKAVLDRLAAGLEEVKQRQEAAEKAEAANAERLAGLVSTERAQQASAAKLELRSNDLAQHQQRIDVAASALAEREKALSAREGAVSAAEAKLAKDAQAFSAKVESHRRALG